MSKDLFIERIELKNYRCHPDTIIGPFSSFNLIYGRNGSGKTSLFEAIELGLTGQIFRAENKKGKDIKKIVARKKDKDFFVKLFNNNKCFASFENSMNIPDLAKLISNLYRIRADGRKARFLLPQMFRTHNLLYSEQIVKLLAADEKEKLDEVLKEIILGREILKTWSYIEESKKYVSEYITKYTTERNENKKEIAQINNEIKEFHIEDDLKIFRTCKELEEKLPFPIWPRETSSEWDLNINNLMKVREATGKIEDAQNHLSLIIPFLKRNKIKKWSDIHEGIDDFKKDEKKIDKKIRMMNKKLVIEQKKLEPIANKENSLNEDIEAKKKDLNQIKSYISEINFIENWLPELNISKRESIENRAILKDKEELRNLEDVFDKFNDIPDVEKIRELQINRENSEYRKKQIQLESGKIKKERVKLHTEKEKIENELSSFQQKEKKLDNSLKEIHILFNNILDLYSSCNCPLCGKKWSSNEDLKNASKNYFKKIKNEFGESSKNAKQYIKQKVELNNKIESFVEKENLLHKELLELDEKLTHEQKQINNIEISLDIIKNLIQDLREPIIIKKDGDIISQIKSLKKVQILSKIKKFRVRIEEKERRLDNAWQKLRRDEFLKEKDELEKSYYTLESELKEKRINISKKWDIEFWINIKNKIAEEQKKLENNLKSIEKRLRELNEKKIILLKETKRIEKRIGVCKETKRILVNKLEKWFQAESNISILLKMGFIGINDDVNEDTLYEKINLIKNRIDALSQQMDSQIKTKKEVDRLTKRLRHLENEIEIQTKLLERCQFLKSKINELRSPEDFEEKIWDEYSNSISYIFQQLHWPQDFTRVYLERKKKDLDLKLEVKTLNNECRSAHERLSSGQRNALAISVFWALCSFSQNIPPVLLMDEPVQSVDDLNILNFLDGLRWLIEGANRQVFITTANQRVADLIRLKFSYLEDKFLDIRFYRGEGLSEIKYFDWRGEDKL